MLFNKLFPKATLPKLYKYLTSKDIEIILSYITFNMDSNDYKRYLNDLKTKEGALIPEDKF